jgi:hypothetical protein
MADLDALSVKHIVIAAQ